MELASLVFKGRLLLSEAASSVFAGYTTPPVHPGGPHCTIPNFSMRQPRANYARGAQRRDS